LHFTKMTKNETHIQRPCNEGKKLLKFFGRSFAPQYRGIPCNMWMTEQKNV